LDLDEIAEGKVTLGKDETEALLVHLLLMQYLKETFHSTAYSINVYVSAGPNAMRLSRLRREDVESGRGPRITLTFAKKAPGKRGGKKEGISRAPSKAGKKRKRVEDSASPDDDDDLDDPMSDERDIDIRDESPEPRNGRQSWPQKKVQVESDSDEDENDWSFSLGNSRPNGASVSRRPSASTKSDGRVIVLSD